MMEIILPTFFPSFTPDISISIRMQTKPYLLVFKQFVFKLKYQILFSGTYRISNFSDVFTFAANFSLQLVSIDAGDTGKSICAKSLSAKAKSRIFFRKSIVAKALPRKHCHKRAALKAMPRKLCCVNVAAEELLQKRYPKSVALKVLPLNHC